MPKQIETLVEDIYNLFEDRTEVKLPYEDVEKFGHNVSHQGLYRRLTEVRGEKANDLRMSNIGRPSCQAFFQKNAPELAEPLTSKTKFKFSYGDYVEEAVLFLAKAAGHEVTGEQDEVNVEGIIGHRDCVIDGVLVDVKSASSYGFQKFQNHGLVFEDSFGYLAQAAGYLAGSEGDVDPTRIAFLVVDKVTGGICLDIYTLDELPDIRKRIAKQREARDAKEVTREYHDEDDGKSGNRKIGTVCSYCAWKHPCWADANDGQGLRTFLYSGRPRFLTNVSREPNVFEVRK